MIWLFLSILFSTSLFIAFKLFSRFKVDMFSAIIVNYFTCFILGNCYLGSANILKLETLFQPGFLQIISTGILFIGTFFLMGTATQKVGAGMSSMASKMSVVLPVLVAVSFFREHLSMLHICGIVLSLISVVLISIKEEGGLHFDWVLLLVFLGSGLVDTGLNLLKNANYTYFDSVKMSTLLFAGAFISGLIIIAVKPSLIKNLNSRSINGGICLGTCNFISLVVMFEGIESFAGKTSLFFTFNNIGVVFCSAVFGLAFKEKLTQKGKIGLGIAILAILLMM